MTLTKDFLICSIYKEHHFSKSKAAELVESFLEIIKRRLEEGEDMLISGFGKFCVKNKSERRGRNPHTGHDLMLGSKRIVTFKCSPVLAKKINGNSKAD